MDFADDMLPRFDLGGQEDHGMTTVTNCAVADDKPIFEELTEKSGR